MNELENDAFADKVANAVYGKIASTFSDFMYNIEVGQNGIQTELEGIKSDVEILKKRNSNKAIAKRIILAVIIALIVGGIALFIFYPWIDTHFM
jgi:hypothetical protein